MNSYLAEIPCRVPNSRGQCLKLTLTSSRYSTLCKIGMAALSTDDVVPGLYQELVALPLLVDRLFHHRRITKSLFTI
mgnify:CR=1 FL=1